MGVVALGQQADDLGALLRGGGQHEAEVEHGGTAHVVRHICR